MSLAGFDIASSTGIFVMEGLRPLHAESWRANVARPKGLKPMEANAAYEAALAEPFRKHVRWVLKEFNVKEAAYEQPRTRDFERTVTRVDPDALFAGQAVTTETQRASSNLSMLRSFGMCVILCGVCHNFGIPCHEVPADEWRKAFIGRARAPKTDNAGRKIPDGRKWLKNQVVEQCRLDGIIVPNDDVGDAVGVAFWLRARLSPIGRARAGDLFSQPAAINSDKKEFPF
jgi:uncharacterized protein YjeT (DUF2065 family)